jgi:hypothetical protein
MALVTRPEHGVQDGRYGGRFAKDLPVGKSHYLVAELPQCQVPCSVLLERRPTAVVPIAVRLHDQLLLHPAKIDRQPTDPRVDGRRRQPVEPAEPEKSALQLAAGSVPDDIWPVSKRRTSAWRIAQRSSLAETTGRRSAIVRTGEVTGTPRLQVVSWSPSDAGRWIRMPCRFRRPFLLGRETSMGPSTAGNSAHSAAALRWLTTAWRTATPGVAECWGTARIAAMQRPSKVSPR